jgi:hypothetical protein
MHHMHFEISCAMVCTHDIECADQYRINTVYE